MVKESFEIKFPEGLHMRPASVLSKMAGKYDCNVILKYGEKEINAKSVVGIVAACIKCGSNVELICDGTDEAKALQDIKVNFEAGLGEE